MGDYACATSMPADSAEHVVPFEKVGHTANSLNQIRVSGPKSEMASPHCSLRKRVDEDIDSNVMKTHNVVPENFHDKRNNYALVCLGTKEATRACQAKDFEYYCDTRGVVKNKGKYTDEDCDEYCECINLDPKPSCILLMSYTFASSCLRKRGDGSDQPLWVEMEVDEIEAAEKRGEVSVNRRWLRVDTQPPGVEELEANHDKRQGISYRELDFGGLKNAGRSTPNPLAHPAFNRVKRVIVSHFRRHNADNTNKQEPQVLENGGLNPDVDCLSLSAASTLRNPLRALGFLYTLYPLPFVVKAAKPERYINAEAADPAVGTSDTGLVKARQYPYGSAAYSFKQSFRYYGLLTPIVGIVCYVVLI